MKIPLTRASRARAHSGGVERQRSLIASRRPPEPTAVASPDTPLTHVERAVKALEQRAQGPSSPASAESSAAEPRTTPIAAESIIAAAVKEETLSAVAVVPAQNEVPTERQAPTQQEIKAAIAEGAATPFDQLVTSEGVPQEPLASDAEQSGKAEPAPEVPELEVERVKRRG